MMKLPALNAAIAVTALILVGTGCDYLKARDHLNKGDAAYNGADYAGAIDHFQQAIELDPDFAIPRLYLATTYMTQWIPGASSPDNVEIGNKARAEFEKVLELNTEDPTIRASALASLASMAYNESRTIPALTPEWKAKLDEAVDWQNKRIQANPDAADAYYTLAVITYDQWRQVWQQKRTELGMKLEEPGPFKDEEIRQELRAEWEQPLKEGLDNLDKALQLDPRYDDAMVYTNLLIRQGADLLDSEEEYTAQIELADGWLDKAMETRRIKAAEAAKSANTGIVSE